MAWELFPNPKSLDNEVISSEDLKAFNDKCHEGAVPPETAAREESVADAISQTPLSGSDEYEDTPF